MRQAKQLTLCQPKPAGDAPTSSCCSEPRKSLKPNRKVSMGSLAGAISVLVIYAAGQDVSAEAAAAITAVAMAVAAYLIPEKKG